MVASSVGPGVYILRMAREKAALLTKVFCYIK